jgi:hypothetical protein
MVWCRRQSDHRFDTLPLASVQPRSRSAGNELSIRLQFFAAALEEDQRQEIRSETVSELQVRIVLPLGHPCYLLQRLRGRIWPRDPRGAGERTFVAPVGSDRYTGFDNVRRARTGRVAHDSRLFPLSAKMGSFRNRGEVAAGAQPYLSTISWIVSKPYV